MNAVSTPTAMVRALSDLLAEDPGVLLLVEGDGPVADAVRARFPDRVIALPVADRAAAAVAVGLAWGGRRPIVELSSAGRLPALTEVLVDAAQVPEGFACPVVLRVPWGDEAGRLDGHGLDGLLGLAGLGVACARDGAHAAGLVVAGARGARPLVVLEPRVTAGVGGAAGADADPSRAQTLREGGDLVLATFGAGVDVALAAAETLAGEGIEASVLDLVALAPLDARAIGQVVGRTGRLVVVSPEPALGRRVVAAAVEGAFWTLEAEPVTVAPWVEAILTAARAAMQD